MAKEDRFKVPNYVVAILLSGAISFNVWAVTAVYARPTETKVKEMISVHSPYVPDRNLVLEAIQDLKKTIDEHKKTLIELKVLLSKD